MIPLSNKGKFVKPVKGVVDIRHVAKQAEITRSTSISNSKAWMHSELK